MSSEVKESEIREILKEILGWGVSGSAKDFVSWTLMYLRQKNRPKQEITKESIAAILEDLKKESIAAPGEFDPSEYQISKEQIPQREGWREDTYMVYGNHVYSPIQYVRSRLEFFLKQNGADEEDVMDISIATIEAIENTVKYGDGNEVYVDNIIDESKKFKISIVNTVKEFQLENEIERGKYSSGATLMRGIMVMQKLFNDLNLEILDDTRQAKLTAEKNLK
jgi:anti-sigma regulatory factor (Ser/Thr protein kinase)